ncbi:MAG: hypothetical protein AAB870_03830, partial [Patescibacteria group bacterium]
MDKKPKTTLQKIEPIVLMVIIAILGYVGYETLLADQIKQFLPGGTLHTQTVNQELVDRKAYYESITALDALYQS